MISPSQLHDQVEQGFLRRDSAFVQGVFNRHKQGEVNLISVDSMEKALAEAHSRTKHLSPLARLTLLGSSSSGIDENAFMHLVQGADDLQTWVEGLPLPQIVADALPVLTSSNDEDDEANKDASLRMVADLSEEQLSQVVEAAASGIKRALVAAQAQLKRCFAEQRKRQEEGNDHSKFCVEVLASGSLKDFHDGLEGRVGLPDLNFEKAMELEHCSKCGHDLAFTSPNYGITTTPQQEWDLVVRNGECSAEQMSHGRRRVNVDDLLDSNTAVSAGLTRPEVIALVLYTGPMFTRYNTMLRRFPQADFEIFQNGGNTFATTIFVLVSAVQKLARVTPIPEGTLLYRGLGGLRDLPKHFVSGDENQNGVRGMTEWAFMSTTADKKIALQYSGAKEGRAKASVLVIEPNAVDKGASIQEFSQYPGEAEFLWVPCSFIQPRGRAELRIEPEGLVTLIHVRVNANLKGDTVEELLEHKKRMHVTAFRTAIDDLRRDLKSLAETNNAEDRLLVDKHHRNYQEKFTVNYLLSRIIGQCEDMLHSHEKHDNSLFTSDLSFRALVTEMLDTVAWAKHKLLLWLSDKDLFCGYWQEWPLRGCHRQWIDLLQHQVKSSHGEQEQRQAALELLKAKGLVKQSIDDKNFDGEGLIYEAAADGWPSHDVALLIQAGASVQTESADSRAAVWVAAANGHAACIAMLLAHGADPSKRSKGDETSPLYMAARNGHTDCIECLLKAGADVNAVRNNLATPVWIAARNGNLECVRLLQAGGVDIHAATSDGRSPLWIAAQNGYLDCVEHLATAGADINQRAASGETPLQAAIKYGQSECAKRLKELGAKE